MRIDADDGPLDRVVAGLQRTDLDRQLTPIVADLWRTHGFVRAVGARNFAPETERRNWTRVFESRLTLVTREPQTPYSGDPSGTLETRSPILNSVTCGPPASTIPVAS